MAAPAPVKNTIEWDDSWTAILEKSFEDLSNLAASDGWNLVKEQYNITISSKIVEGSPLNVMRGELEFDFSVEEVGLAISDIPGRKEWDRLLVEVPKVLSQWEDKKVMIGYMKFIGQWPIAQRDMCVLMSFKRTDGENSKALCIGTSIVNPGCPEVNGIVRANILASGFVLEPLGPNKTKVTYLIQLELGGWIPAWVTNFVGTEAPLALGRLLRVMRQKRDAQKKTAEQGETKE
mmetsp:Transcript_1502/g.1700  ORF Transcript_1502/g.1700 Transcript_1502/m.1700 type:complete len:234 (+) Transcript_1502:25-726(+)